MENRKSLEPWNPGTLELWNPGTLEPQKSIREDFLTAMGPIVSDPNHNQCTSN